MPLNFFHCLFLKYEIDSFSTEQSFTPESKVKKDEDIFPSTFSTFTVLIEINILFSLFHYGDTSTRFCFVCFEMEGIILWRKTFCSYSILFYCNDLIALLKMKHRRYFNVIYWKICREILHTIILNSSYISKHNIIILE